MSDDNNEEETFEAHGIIDMLKEAGVTTQCLEDKEHKFWDTQVRNNELVISSLWIMTSFLIAFPSRVHSLTH
jgi:hypothetical protein